MVLAGFFLLFGALGISIRKGGPQLAAARTRKFAFLSQRSTCMLEGVRFIYRRKSIREMSTGGAGGGLSRG